jgi:hypothetical protein
MVTLSFIFAFIALIFLFRIFILICEIRDFKKQKIRDCTPVPYIVRASANEYADFLKQK